ncbi:aldehyde dehydrogenase family protein [Rhodococcus sp. T2V]|uniref:aldehyde dehydrogenase family protein n=1 Tax=Rhodococcus sp. T2V TaxID=3034164 RepID=UPI0023E16EFF|nr:aldehyde dehydrogenase family protein [Rhodococcus sp. T2V]MDF3311475.1 aldehyde dehydrogenase family protein [Rhodococcus sp. T2V]
MSDSAGAIPVQRNFIGGEWVAAANGKTYQRFNPYDQTLVGIYQDSDEADVVRAVKAAREAFDDGPWHRMSAIERATILRRAASLMRERADSLAVTLTKEVGQPAQQATVNAEADQLDYYAGLIVSRRDESVYTQHDDAIGIVAKEPVGVVGVLTAWNAPLSIAHKACPAMAAGCTLVVKPGHQAPGAVVQLAEILEEAGLPPGVFNLITSAIDNGAVVGQAIAADEMVDMVTFTGSSLTGRAVMRAAAGNLTPVHLELGGKSPNVVFADTHSLEQAAAAVAKGIVRLAGQSCQAGSRLLVQESVKDDFVDLVLEHLRAAKLGDPFDEATTCGPLVSEEQLNRVAAYVEAGKASSRLLTGGRRPDCTDLHRGFFFEPTVFDNVAPDSRIAQEEVFGPVLSILSFKELDDAIHLANATKFGLAAGCWTRDINTALRFAKGVRAGIVWLNSYRDDSVLKHMPMGGFKHSGIGREWGPEGLEAFLETKSIMLKLS